MEKKCTQCGEVKALEMFHARASALDGKIPNCKECRRKYHAENNDKINLNKRKYYAENKEQFNLKQKKHRAENKGKTSLRDKKYRADNKEKISLYKKKYQAENKEKISLCRKKYYAENEDRLSLIGKKYKAENVKQLKDSYVIDQLKVQNLPITEATMNYKRNTIQIHRLLKELK